MLTHHIWVQGLQLHSQFHLPADTRRDSNSPSTWLPATHVRKLRWSVWLWRGLALATEDIWGMNMQVSLVALQIYIFKTSLKERLGRAGAAIGYGTEDSTWDTHMQFLSIWGQDATLLQIPSICPDSTYDCSLMWETWIDKQSVSLSRTSHDHCRSCGKRTKRQKLCLFSVSYTSNKLQNKNKYC